MSVSLPFKRLSQEDCHVFKTTVGYEMRMCLNSQNGLWVESA